MEEKFVSPVYRVARVPFSKIQSNAYNPNVMAPPEMELLKCSILEDGYTMPIVCYYIEESDRYEIVDGFHRYKVMESCEIIWEREKGFLPVTIIDKPLSNRMASTIRHNRARGVHSVELMVSIVGKLAESGVTDQWIIENIGMDKDEILRLKQISGLASLFIGKEFSSSWESGDEEGV
jgi:ParB-like chromosome segregation protein Spo0J